MRGRVRNKEWHLFLLAYPKTSFVSVTMPQTHWSRQGCEAVARTWRRCSVAGTGKQPTLFLHTAPVNTNGFWFPGFEVQTAYLAFANVCVYVFAVCACVCMRQPEGNEDLIPVSGCCCLYFGLLGSGVLIFKSSYCLHAHGRKVKFSQSRISCQHQCFCAWASNLDLQTVGMLASASSLPS